MTMTKTSAKLKPKRLGTPRIYYDRQVKMWVVIDKDTHVATQAETKELLQETFIDALRCMCASLWDIENRRAGTRRGK
jgi:hypothetical protein